MTHKNRLWLALIAPALLFAACADNLEQPTENIYDRFNASGEAFMTLDLNIPGAPTSTRAATFEDGEKKEYVVTKATLIIFGCDPTKVQTPENMYYRTARNVNWDYDAGTDTYTPAEEHSGVSYTDRVTQWHSKIFRLKQSAIREKERLYAFVLVNNAATIDEEANTVTIGTTTLKNEETDKADNSFKKLMDTTLDEVKVGDSFFMTNAPMANQGRDEYNASTIAVTYLPEIYATNIYPTEQQAKDNPATSINVERMAAKVTLNGNTTLESGTLTTKSDVNYYYKNIYYCTDARNKKSYVVRHIDVSDLGKKAITTANSVTPTYRFLDSKYTTPGQYRIFWCRDFNYETKPDERGPNNDRYYFYDGQYGGSIYLHENTMSEEYLKQEYTTRLIIRVPFSVGTRNTTLITANTTGDDAISTAFKGGAAFAVDDKVYNEGFYTLSIANSDEIFLADGIKERYYTTDAGGTVSSHEDAATSKVNDKEGHTVAEKILQYVGQLEEFKTWKASLSTSAKALSTSELLNVIMFRSIQGQPLSPYVLPAYGKAKVLLMLNTDKVTDTDDQAKFKAAFCSTATDYKGYVVAENTDDGTKFHYENDLDQAVNKEIAFNYYEKGYAYYKVLIRHFDDDEVAAYKDDKGSAYDNVYPATNRADNYLGRYGIVRNTWYNVILTGIRHLGYSDDVPLNDTPDDEVDNYLSAKVLVNKWATREQHNTL